MVFIRFNRVLIKLIRYLSSPETNSF